MKKSSLNTIVVGYIRNHLSPLQKERDFITKRYGELSTMLQGKTFQSGSYARFTTITPVNDLDMIWIIERTIVQKTIDPNSLDFPNLLSDLAQRLRGEYQKLGIAVRIKAQSHSIGIYFGKTDEEFSIDVVPAIPTGDKNEHQDDVYLVPEILRLSKANRVQKYAKQEKIAWIRSDPRGYIKQAELLNAQNEEFRKATKFVKRWKYGCKTENPNFPLKSFHLELIITHLFLTNPSISCIEAIHQFFFTLSSFLVQPQLPDKADRSKFTDDYINTFSEEEKKQIEACIKSCAQMLEKMGEVHNEGDVISLIGILLSGKAALEREATEEFLFDHSVPVAIDPTIQLTIDGIVLEATGGFRSYSLKGNGNRVYKERRIEFRVTSSTVPNYVPVYYKWKVKNQGTEATELRGEITNHQTRNSPERTKYRGIHYVECYAIVNNVCVAKARQTVNIVNYGE